MYQRSLSVEATIITDADIGAIKTIKMNESIKVSVLDFLDHKISNGALLIDGDWGSGKTYFIQNEVVPELIKQKDTSVIYLSLFGLSSSTELKNSILLKSVIGSEIQEGNLSKVRDRTSKLLSKIGVLSKFVSALEVSDLVDFKKVVYIFDDIERVPNKGLLVEFMGIISTSLIEKKNYKVILVGNLDKLNNKNFFLYKEKFVNTIIDFKSNPDIIVSGIIDRFNSESNEILKALKAENKLIKKIISQYHISNFRAVSQSFDLISLISRKIDPATGIFLLKEIVYFTLTMNCEFRNSQSGIDEFWSDLSRKSYLGEWPFINRRYKYIDFSKPTDSNITCDERASRIQSFRYFSENDALGFNTTYSWEPLFFHSIFQLITKGFLDDKFLKVDCEDLMKVKKERTKNNRYRSLNNLQAWQDLNTNEYDKYKKDAILLINKKDIPIHVFFRVVQYFLAINESVSSLVEDITIDSIIGAYKSNDFISRKDTQTEEYYLSLRYKLEEFPKKIRDVIKYDMQIIEKRERVRRSEKIIKKMAHFFSKDVEIVINLLTYCDPEVASKKIVEFILAKQKGFSDFLASLEGIIRETSFRNKGRLAYENVEQIINEINLIIERKDLSQLDEYRYNSITSRLDKIASLYKAFTLISKEELINAANKG